MTRRNKKTLMLRGIIDILEDRASEGIIINEIARHVGISHSAFFYHWPPVEGPSLHAAFSEAFLWAVENEPEAARKIYTRESLSSTSFIQKLVKEKELAQCAG